MSDISVLHLICDISLREAIQLSGNRALGIKAVEKHLNLGDLGDVEDRGVLGVGGTSINHKLKSFES